MIVLIVSRAVKENDDSVIAARYDTTPLTLSKCESLDVYGNVYNRPDGCVSLIWAPAREPYTLIMNSLKSSLGWSDYDIQAFDTTDDMSNWMYENFGLAEMMVTFDRLSSLSYPYNPHRVYYEVDPYTYTRASSYIISIHYHKSILVMITMNHRLND